MQEEIVFKLAFVVTACSLSWGAASYFAYSSLIVLEKQRISSTYFRNFFILFGLAFLTFAIATSYINSVTIFINNALYMTAFYFLKKGFSSLNGEVEDINNKLKREFLIIIVLLFLINSLFFHIVYNSHLLRTITIILIALYYCISCLGCIETNVESIGKIASRRSMKACILLMGIMIITLIVSGSSYLYLITTMISQCILILLLFGSTLIIFLGETSAQFKKESITDYLTGLYNRRLLNERLKEIINSSQRNLTPISLIMVDIDHFKVINDNYGHDAGDLILKSISHVLIDSVRASDIAARVGGEEFCLILPNTDIDGAMLLSKRMCKKIEDIETEYKHEKLKVTASFGVSEVDINKSVDEALKNTDIALYESKLNGRNRVSLYRSPVIKTMNSEVTS
jgi:diguanylate cyclase (GGDEF)-like protein